VAKGKKITGEITWRWRWRVVKILRAENAFPEEAAKTKRDRGTQSSIDRCSVLETNKDTAEEVKGSTVIQVGRDWRPNISVTRSTIALRFSDS